MTTFSVYLGDTRGLYKALAEGGAATSSELASRAGIHERYAREWLEQQAVDGILDAAEASDGLDAAALLAPLGTRGRPDGPR